MNLIPVHNAGTCACATGLLSSGALVYDMFPDVSTFVSSVPAGKKKKKSLREKWAGYLDIVASVKLPGLTVDAGIWAC